MNIRDKIRALEPKIVAASLQSGLTLGKLYTVGYDDGTRYGLWKFEALHNGLLYFVNQHNARLSIPASNNKVTPAQGWIVIPESKFSDRTSQSD